jgi:hypothetical protein
MTRALEWDMQMEVLWMVLRMQHRVTGRGQLGMTAAHGNTRHRTIDGGKAAGTSGTPGLVHVPSPAMAGQLRPVVDEVS